MDVGLKNHYICCAFSSKIMIQKKLKGLIVNISSEGGAKYMFNVLYGIQKVGVSNTENVQIVFSATA